MKNSMFLLGLAFPLFLQAQIHEDFTGSGYPHDLRWRGHTAAFAINSDAQLQSQTINTTYISTENQLATGVVWDVGVKLGFPPSSNNQLRIYLIADRDTLDGPLNGYFLEIGEDGSSDGYRLYRQAGEYIELLLNSPPIERLDPAMIYDRIKVIRDTEGDWELQIAIDNATTFRSVGAVRDTVFNQTAFFGFLCRFTQSNSNRFHFDHFSIDTTDVNVDLELPPAEDKLLPDDVDSAMFYDDFSKGIQPHWHGDNTTFETQDQRLKLTENAPSPAFIAVANNRLANTVWEVGIQVDGPLSSGRNGNNVRLYLAMSDSLLHDHDGYHLEIDGAKAKHVYHIWRQTGNSRSHVFQSDSIPNLDNRFRARVRVVRDTAGNWRISADEYDTGVFIPLPDKSGKISVPEDTFNKSQFAGLFANFSKTRWSDYSFHYFLIKSNGTAADTISDIDTIAPGRPYDVVINEMMVNPNGAAGLPPVEYVELYNATNDTVVLDGWTLKSLTRNTVIPKVALAPKDYLLLYPMSDRALVDYVHEAIGLSGWPPLVNDGTTITLQDPYGTVVDEVSYAPSWYRDSKKKRGGWSLERITPYAPCLDTANWTASTDSSGGTPGMPNSVYDADFSVDFELIGFTVQSSAHFLLTYSHKIDPLTAGSTANYRLNNGFGEPTNVRLVGQRSVLLQYDGGVHAGNEYLLTGSGITDCSGSTLDFEHAFFIPDTAISADILINEILFNPKSKGMENAETDGVDFVEIYNHSSKTVDLQEFDLAHINPDGIVAGHRQVSTTQQLFYPGEYKVLTTQPDIVQAHYPKATRTAFVQMESLPRFNNDAGTALLIAHGQTIDSLSYRESMHAPFIKNRKGISLERKRFDTATNAPGNFYSAATSVGGATPGYRNSQGATETGQPGIRLRSQTFSPDGDGFEDDLQIDYHFAESGNMATILIFDSQGHLVRQLQRNQSMALEGSVTWDGRSDTGQRLPVGIYVAHIEIYSERGNRNVYRKSFVLATKL